MNSLTEQLEMLEKLQTPEETSGVGVALQALLPIALAAVTLGVGHKGIRKTLGKMDFEAPNVFGTKDLKSVLGAADLDLNYGMKKAYERVLDSAGVGGMFR